MTESEGAVYLTKQAHNLFCSFFFSFLSSACLVLQVVELGLKSVEEILTGLSFVADLIVSDYS